jgi:diacylglycerol kinase family enzyme
MSQQYNHALVIKNGQASKLKRFNEKKFDCAVIAPLEDYGIHYDILDRPMGPELDSIIQEDSLLVICGGDGTVTRIANYVLNRELSNTILPLHFGGANDIANGLYGNMNLEDILTKGKPDIAYTIEATIEKDAEVLRVIRALGYIGIGTSGHSAKAINKYQGKDTTESGAIMHATRTAFACKSFDYLDSENNLKKAIELLAINNRMARYIKSRHNTTFSPEFTFIEAKDRMRMIGKLCLGLLGNADGTRFEGDRNNSIRILSQTVLQSDGEHVNLEPGTDVTFKTGPPINIVRV